MNDQHEQVITYFSVLKVNTFENLSWLQMSKKKFLMNASVFFAERKEKCERVFAMHIHRDEFHPEQQIRVTLLSFIVISVFLTLNRAMWLGEMEN